MNIIVFGAGAIGSLYGAILSKKNNVTLIGRSNHVNAIKKDGLIVKGKTQLKVRISAEENTNKIEKSPDLLILTVKSYDTTNAILDIGELINQDTAVLSLQNGLDNIEKIEKSINKKQILAGITTHGAFIPEPGIVEHTGLGSSVVGELDGIKTSRLKRIVKIFNDASIITDFSENILREIWIKAIINSSINPLTTIFQCKNGYLLENPILEKIVAYVCKESTIIANKNRQKILNKFTQEKTKEVIRSTSENYSSMVQSFNKRKQTEIDSINGKIVEIGLKHSVDVTFNKLLVDIIQTFHYK